MTILVALARHGRAGTPSNAVAAALRDPTAATTLQPLGAVALVAARDLRRRWPRVLALIVTIGVAGACTIAGAAGARRSSTALARFKSSSRSADLELQTPPPTPAQVGALRATPHVAAVAVLRAYGILIPESVDFQGIVVPADAQAGTAIDVDRIVAGRRPNPETVDEVTIGEGLARRLHRRVGDVLRIATMTPAQVNAILAGAPDAGTPRGPAATLRIVGIVRRPLDLGDERSSGGLVVLTPAFRRAYGDRIGVFGARVRVRTDDGAADVSAVTDAARRIFGDLFSAQGLALQSQGAGSAIDVLTFALWIFAALAALVGACAIAVLVGREIDGVAADSSRWRSIGLTRGERIGVTAPVALLMAAGGAVLSVVGAIAFSPLFPLGVARRADPSVGVHADWVALLLGAVGTAALVLVVAATVAWRVTAAPSWEHRARRAARPSFADRLAAGGAVPAVTHGIRLALERGGARGVLPVRAAVAAAVVGVVGVTGVLVVASNVDDVVGTPARYGIGWDFNVADTTNNTPCGGDDYGLGRVLRVAALAEVCAQNVDISGRPVSAVAFTTLHGADLTVGITAGRAPSAPDEVALGAKTLRTEGKHLGDTVIIAGRRASRRFTIVGRAVFPTMQQSQPLADGAAFTGAGYAPLFDQDLFQRSFVGRYASGADRVAVDRAIDAIPQLGTAAPPVRPDEVDRLAQIRWLPVLSVVLFAALAVLALAHALTTSVRRRRGGLAVLKALGFSGRQVRATVATEATTIALVGLVVGVPVGIACGLLLWRRVASNLGVDVAPAMPLIALVIMAVVIVALANLMAWSPGRVAARTRPAAVLRSD